MAKSDASAEDDVSLELGDETSPVVFFEGCNFSFFEEDTSTIPAASCYRILLRFIDADDFFHLDGILGNLMTAPSCTYLCHEQVTASSAIVRSLTLFWAKRKVAFSFSAAATTAFPFATFALSSTTCAVGTQHWRLGKSRPAPEPLVGTL